MIDIRRRKGQMGEKTPVPEGTKTSPGSPPGKSTRPEPAPPMPRLSRSEEDMAVDKALMIAQANQAQGDGAYKELDDDIERLLGSLGDDDDDEDFPVNRASVAGEMPPDDQEESFPDYAPVFAVPHNVPEVTGIVNNALDILLEHKQKGLALTSCEAPAEFLAEDASEGESENHSIRSYRRLLYDLTKEVLTDTVSPEEVAPRPPWVKAKSAGKLSRNFKRWRNEEEVRASVLERVMNLIGLGAPRTTMQTLQRKTPVRGNKKDDVDAILIEELRDEEPQWTNYDDDETTVKFQVADSILEMLLEDTVRVFNAIDAKKHVPEGVLVV